MTSSINKWKIVTDSLKVVTDSRHWLTFKNWKVVTGRVARNDRPCRTLSVAQLIHDGCKRRVMWPVVTDSSVVTDARPSNSLNRQCGQSTGALHPKGLVGGKPELPYPVYSPAGLQLTVSVHWLIMMSLVITWHLSDKQACQASEKPIIKSINTTN